MNNISNIIDSLTSKANDLVGKTGQIQRESKISGIRVSLAFTSKIDDAYIYTPFTNDVSFMNAPSKLPVLTEESSDKQKIFYLSQVFQKEMSSLIKAVAQSMQENNCESKVLFGHEVDASSYNLVRKFMVKHDFVLIFKNKNVDTAEDIAAVKVSNSLLDLI